MTKRNSLAFAATTSAAFPAGVPPVAIVAPLAIDASNPDLAPQAGHLKVGGSNPAGVEINANSRHLTLGGKPWFPVVGEFHYTRYPRAEWEDELRKMKAGGINVVATYVIWIYHEEEKGKWDWSGDRDLRAFVETCRKVGIFCYPRLGPWVHAEVRNGGLPDWLLRECGGAARTDSEPYLGYVRTFFGQIARQLEGLLWKDGGPVIGTQIENELTNNPQHLLTLKNLARESGIDVPLYTVTGWMGVKFPENEVLPVFGGYPDAFWAKQSDGWARESRANYIFTHNRDDSTIGADLAEAGAGEVSLSRYPYGTVELGGGMQVSYRRRPVIEADDIAAITLSKLGSGSNMQGYYMYHGGANKVGRLSTLQESRATGYPNDMPVIDYDFQAPLGKLGQKRGTFDALRVLHLFLADFGGELAPMPSILPEKQPQSLDDRETLRWSVRSDGQRGFLFINNYQRIETLPAHEGVQFEVKLKGGTLKVPSEPTCIPAQSYMIWPFNMMLGGALLRYSTAQLLCRVGDTFVFFAPEGVAPEFEFDPQTVAEKSQARVADLRPGSLVTVKACDGADARILLLSEEQARQAYKVKFAGAERLFLTKATLFADGDDVRLRARDPGDLTAAVYPPLNDATKTNENFQHFSGVVPAEKISIEWEQVKTPEPAAPVRLDKDGVPLPPDDADFDRAGVWRVRIPKDALRSDRKAVLRVDYDGDVARAYLGDRLIDDDFYFGRAWEIGRHRFTPEELENGLALKILPLRKDAPIYIPADRRPQFNDRGEAVGIRSITVEPEYELDIAPPRAGAVDFHFPHR